MNIEMNYMSPFREAMAIMDDIERELDATDARLAAAKYLIAAEGVSRLAEPTTVTQRGASHSRT